MKILFIGSVSLSASFLNELILMNQKIVAVFTSSKTSINSDHYAMESIAYKYDIPCYFTDDINSYRDTKIIEDLNPDIIFCFGWSRLLQSRILSVPRLGTIGFHPAELPANRGRHPIIWALVLGLQKTASTFFYINEGIDSGDIVDQEIVEILPEDDANILYEKIRNTAIKQLNKFVPKLIDGKLKTIPQNSESTNYWRKRSKNDGIIDWRMSSTAIYNLIRALTKPYPGASFFYKNKEYKALQSKIHQIKLTNIEPGKVLKVEKNSLIVKTGDSAIEILKIEPNLKISRGDYL